MGKQWFLNYLSLVIKCTERKERNVLFNDTLSTFYLWLYGIKLTVKDHSDSERGNLLPPHGLLFPVSSNVFFYMHHPTDRIAHTMTFVTPLVVHWLEREIAQWVHHEGSIQWPIAPWADTLPWSYILLCDTMTVTWIQKGNTYFSNQ